MALRKLGRPVGLQPVVAPTPAVRELVRKPEPGEAALPDASEGRETFTASFRMTADLNNALAHIMEVRDTSKSEAIKYAIRVVAHALGGRNASLILDGSDGPETIPLIRNGVAT